MYVWKVGQLGSERVEETLHTEQIRICDSRPSVKTVEKTPQDTGSVPFHLKCVFSGSISGSQGRPGEPNDAADSHNAPSPPLRHVGQHLLGDGDRAKEVELHQSLIHVHACVYAQRALGSTAIVDEYIDLREPCENVINQWDQGDSMLLVNQAPKDSRVQSAQWQPLFSLHVRTFPTDPVEAQKRFDLGGRSILHRKTKRKQAISKFTEVLNIRAIDRKKLRTE